MHCLNRLRVSMVDGVAFHHGVPFFTPIIRG